MRKMRLFDETKGSDDCEIKAIRPKLGTENAVQVFLADDPERSKHLRVEEDAYGEFIGHHALENGTRVEIRCPDYLNALKRWQKAWAAASDPMASAEARAEWDAASAQFGGYYSWQFGDIVLTQKKDRFGEKGKRPFKTRVIQVMKVYPSTDPPKSVRLYCWGQDLKLPEEVNKAVSGAKPRVWSESPQGGFVSYGDVDRDRDGGRSLHCVIISNERYPVRKLLLISSKLLLAFGSFYLLTLEHKENEEGEGGYRFSDRPWLQATLLQFFAADLLMEEDLSQVLKAAEEKFVADEENGGGENEEENDEDE